MIKLNIFVLVFSISSIFIFNKKDHKPVFKKPDDTSNNFIWGINGHPLSQIAYINSDLDTQFALIKKLGLTYYRIDIPTDKNGNISNSASFVKIMNSAKAHQIKILPVFYLVGFDPTTDASTAFNNGKNLGSSISKKYGNYFDYYELGNEEEFKIMKPNSDGDQLSNYDIAKGKILAAFLNGMINGIKIHHPSAKTIIDFAGWLHFGYLTLLRNENVNYDIVGLHWYSEMGKLTDINSKHINIINLLADKFGKPIWITEINKQNINSEERNDTQAYWLQEYINESRQSTHIKAFFVYELFDEPAFGKQPEANYGIIKWVTPYTRYSFKPATVMLKSQIIN